MEPYWLLMLLPLAAIGGWLFAIYDLHQKRDKRPIATTWFKGLNFLLNEQPDKALEVFLAASQIDEETVEIHLALGNLFRRRGEIERATRIHQNLVARADIDPQLRSLALFELSQDYFKAGLYDRAENLFQEIREIPEFQEQACKFLLQIYDQEKEWASAILVAEILNEKPAQEYSESLAQYCCELAESAISEGRNCDADTYLAKAISYQPHCVRATIQLGRLAAISGNHEKAIAIWKNLQNWSPESLGEVVDHLANSYKASGGKKKFKSFLQQAIDISSDTRLISTYIELIREEKGRESGQAVMLEWVRKHPTLEGVHQLIKARANPASGQQGRDFSVLADLLYDVVYHNRHYNCGKCGFSSDAIHWQCPSCKGWGTISKSNGVRRAKRYQQASWISSSHSTSAK